PTLSAIAEKLGPLEGIIGFPFFARYRMTIDYQKSELTLVPSGYVPGDATEELQNKLIELQQRKGAPRMGGSPGLWGMVVGKDREAAQFPPDLTGPLPRPRGAHAPRSPKPTFTASASTARRRRRASGRSPCRGPCSRRPCRPPGRSPRRTCCKRPPTGRRS